MAIDINKLKQKLNQMNNKNATRDAIWKPTGEHVIRIVPYSHTPDNPFIELKFHYGLNNKTILSPSTFDRPDPIVELANTLKKTGLKEDFEQAKDLEPKTRYYVPIIIRGEEEKGVKFWGFGKQTCEEIMTLIADPDWGDITDLKEGHDISVNFIPKEQTVKKKFPETKISPKPKVTIAFDPTNKDLMAKVKNQKNILDLFPEPTYDELKKELEKWLTAGAESTTEQSGDTTKADSTTEVVEDEPVVKKDTTAATPKVTASTKDVEDAFDEMFKK